jgi:hypothetical protein
MSYFRVEMLKDLDISGAEVGYTAFTNIDLSAVNGLYQKFPRSLAGRILKNYSSLSRLSVEQTGNKVGQKK